MASNYPVDEGNLSFSDEDGSELFITQSTFRDISVEKNDENDDFFESVSGDVSSGDNPNVQQQDLANLVVPEDWHEHKSLQFFDFSDQLDNGYEVSTQEPFVLTRHYDGKKFVVGDGIAHDKVVSDVKSDSNKDEKIPKYNEETVEADLKRFGQVVDDNELDMIRRKK